MNVFKDKNGLEEFKKYLDNPKNIEKLNAFFEKELQSPCFTHLQCCEGCCKYNRPEGFVEMGTITWCDKYLEGQEELCEKECGNRTWIEGL